MRILADATDIVSDSSNPKYASLIGHIEELFGPPECRKCEGWDDDGNEWEIDGEGYCTNPNCEDEGVAEVILPKWLSNYLFRLGYD